jgi:hypothetical protein
MRKEKHRKLDTQRIRFLHHRSIETLINIHSSNLRIKFLINILSNQIKLIRGRKIKES